MLMGCDTDGSSKKMGGVNINNHLTEDLLKEIFVRLPCKFAIRSKSVCKLWHSIISNPCFASGHIAHQLRGNCVEELSFHIYKQQFILSPPLPGLEVSLDFLPCFQGEQGCYGSIHSSCNGLVLCSWRRSGDTFYFVCNPFTKQWAAIPPAPLPDYLACIQLVGFVCEPYYHVNNLGGVIMNPHCRFRIVRAFGDSLPDESVIALDVFSSETGEWAKVKIGQQNLMRFSSTCPQQIISYNGRIYLQIGLNIVVYDPYQNEVVCEIDLPEPEDGVRNPLPYFEGFSCSCGSLWMCQLNNHLPFPKLSMWKLKEDERGLQYWSLERQVTNSDPMRRTCLAKDCLDSGRVLAIHPNNSDIIYFSISWCNIIVAWNLGTGTTEVVFQNEVGFKSWTSWLDAFVLDVPVWPIPVPKVLRH